MVSTRMQTLAMTGRTTADTSLFQKLNKLSLNTTNKLGQASKCRRNPSTPRITKLGSPIRSPKRSTKKNKLTKTQVNHLCAAIPAREDDEFNPDLVKDIGGSSNFFPSVIIGAHEIVGLSIIGRADKEIRMWEQVLADHQREQPSLAPVVEEKLKDARKKMALIDESLEENWRVGDTDPAANAIKARLEALQWALDTSKFEPEAANIRCAIEGYRSGGITYSTQYTLIWAGKIVDTAPHYRSFTVDRSARLDRYFEKYGSGWFFYEAPLKVHPSLKPKLCASVTLKRPDAFHSLQSYYITQGYWKRADYVSRMSILARSASSLQDPLYFRDSEGKVDCGPAGPRLAFKSLLDSGATFPSLHDEDFHHLGVDMNWYAAQSIQMMATATGFMVTRLYELFVTVLDDKGKQLVDEHDAVYPYFPKYVGGLCPVAQSQVPLRYDENGIEIPFRLSGMLPFVACYLSSTPGRNMLFLGEDRNDVLGSHRMPGQKKWTTEMPPIAPGLPFDRYDNPHIRFTHRGGKIIDVDRTDKKHASIITFMGGTPEEVVVESDPAERHFEMRLAEHLQAQLEDEAAQNVQVQPAPGSKYNP